MYAVITGASRGIGRALAYKFGENGYNLILTCEKNIELLRSVKNDIEKKYKKTVIIKEGLLDECDLKDDIYCLINNAGKCDYNLFQDITYNRYKEIVYANLDYNFLTTKLVLKKMLCNKQGVIINISSMWGIVGSSMETIYSMTKGGINALTKSLAKEFLTSGIDVIAFALGAVDTDMNSNLVGEERENFIKTLDNNRMWQTSEVADKIFNIFLNRNYKSGDIIEVNNGL